MAKTQHTIVHNFMEDVWKVMTPAMIERLKQILTEDFGQSKTDANNFIQWQRDIRRRRICLKKITKEVRIGPRNKWIKELSKDIADQVAKFVVGILLSERNDTTKKFTEHILDRLCEVTGENTTIKSAKTRVERILVVVADRLATWINENVSDIELLLKGKLTSTLDTLSSVKCAPQKSIDSLLRSDLCSSDFSGRSKDSLVTFDSEVSSVRDETEISSEDEKEDDLKSSLLSDEEEDSEDESDESASEKESSAQESEEESTRVQESEEESTSFQESEEVSTDDEEDREEEGSEYVDEEESEESKPSDGASDEEESEEGESGEVEIEYEEEEILEEEKSVPDEIVTLEEKEEEERKLESILTGTVRDHSESEITGAGSPINILDLLKEDLEHLHKTEDKSDRQQVLREAIDKRLNKIAQEKLKRSLDSVIRYDIDETASVVANWVEKILSAADGAALLPLVTEPKQGSAFAVMRGDGSQLKVQKISSTAAAKQVAELRGLELPQRKKKLPRTMSPINIKSINDWADWTLGAADVGNEWEKWIDETLEDVEIQLAKDRDSKTGAERHEAWTEWREKKAQEAHKWRAEKRRIREEGALWDRKLQKTPSEKPEQETKVVTY